VKQTRSTERTPPDTAVPPRINQTNNNISDFFRPRIQPHRLGPARTTTNTTPPPAAPLLPTNPTILIPIQVIMDSQLTAPTNVEGLLQAAAPPRVMESPMEVPITPQSQLQQAQTLWAKMFRTSQAITPADGNRPIILSRENQRSNAAWGDNLSIKSPTVTRVNGMNVNGLSLDQRGGQLDVLCKVIKEVQADVFCGQEHNLASDSTHVRQILYRTARQHWKRSRITFGTTPITFPKQYKPGGTFIITAGDLTGLVIAQTQDKWGRWVTQTYQDRGRTKISIYSA
jgi:hypothetical protein